ncbi:MAG: YdcH family protein [Gammaproteobacteria bacterium]|nr:YdcH family protein [Gammaproteobacteria bacterium]
MSEAEAQILRQRIETLRLEHRDLDDVIDRLAHDPNIDQLQIKRLKKRKLLIKDLIQRLESDLIPDLDA